MELPAGPAASPHPSCLPLPASLAWGSLAGVQAGPPTPAVTLPACPGVSLLLSSPASAFTHSTVIARRQQSGAAPLLLPLCLLPSLGPVVGPCQAAAEC